MQQETLHPAFAGTVRYETAVVPDDPDSQVSHTIALMSRYVREDSESPEIAAASQDTTDMSFDQWNWYLEQRIGVPGPGPEVFSITRTDPMPAISFTDWWASVGPWVEQQGHVAAALSGLGYGWGRPEWASWAT